MAEIIKYVKLIVPLRFRETVTYSVPSELGEEIAEGCRVNILLANKPYKAIVQEIISIPDFAPEKIKEICSIDAVKPLSEGDIPFLRAMADYYMCSVGEVLKAAAPLLTDFPVKKTKKKEETAQNDAAPLPYLNINILTPLQLEAFEKIRESHRKGRTVLLDGVSCSGKTEIYIHAAKENLDNGKNTLILIPDALSSQDVINRFRAVFGQKLLFYDKQLTPAKKRNSIEALAGTSCNSPAVVIGTRQSIFLPLGNLGLVIVDDEHDSAYKQPDPAPRYNGRDAALLLAKAKGAKVILGSSAPSFESLFNASAGKYDLVTLPQMYPGCRQVKVTVIDSSAEKKKKAIIGSYTTIAAKAVAAAVKNGREIAVFKPGRAFAKDDDLAAEIITLFHDSGISLVSELSDVEALEKRPSLIVLLQGEALLNSQDFRGDEKAIQLLTRLKSLLQRGECDGELIIQTSQPRHNVFKALGDPSVTGKLMKEREEFGFPPYKRMIQITLKDQFEQRLERKGEKVMKIIASLNIEDFLGPVKPPFEKIPDMHTLIFRIKLKRDRSQESLKRKLLSALESQSDLQASIDVDPL